MPEVLLTLSEVARVMGVSRVRVWQLVRGKRLPAQRVGRLWAVKPADARDLVEQRAKKGGRLS